MHGTVIPGTHTDAQVSTLIQSLHKALVRTAGGNPRCMPFSPSFLHVFANTSRTLLYTRFPPPFASSPCSCRRVLATSAGLEKVTCGPAPSQDHDACEALKYNGLQYRPQCRQVQSSRQLRGYARVCLPRTCLVWTWRWVQRDHEPGC